MLRLGAYGHYTGLTFATRHRPSLVGTGAGSGVMEQEAAIATPIGGASIGQLGLSWAVESSKTSISKIKESRRSGIALPSRNKTQCYRR